MLENNWTNLKNKFLQANNFESAKANAIKDTRAEGKAEGEKIGTEKEQARARK